MQVYQRLLHGKCTFSWLKPLQLLTGEKLSHRTANTEDGARLDVKVHDVNFLTLGFSTPTHKVTVQPNYPQLTPN